MAMLPMNMVSSLSMHLWLECSQNPTDENYIVQHSISIGKPIIVVAFNYRVGYYGFLSSKELKAEAKSRGDNGFANLGFHDQRLALQWVRKSRQLCLYWTIH